MAMKTMMMVALLVGSMTGLAGVTDVTRFGAVGDGKTDDTAAIMKAWAEAAKDGGVLYFPKTDKGSVYLTRKSVILVSGMTVTADPGAVLASASAVLEGGGETLRKQVVKDSVKGATSVEVDDASGLRVGQEITIWQDEGSYRETLADIVKIEGNVVHFDTSRFTSDGTNKGNLNDRAGGKAVLLTDFSLVKTIMAKEAVGARVENLTIRSCGNRTDPYIYTISPFHQTAQNRPTKQDHLTLFNVTIDGSSQDGISTQGGGDIWIRKCTVRNVKHKGIHWGTSCDKVFVLENLCENCGSAAYEQVSNNGGTGAMYFCVNNHRVLILDNVIRNCYKGVFGYDYRGWGEWDTDSVVSGNLFENCTLGGCWLHDGWRINVTANLFRNFGKDATPIAFNECRIKRRTMKSGLVCAVVADNVLADFADDYANTNGAIRLGWTKGAAVTGNKIVRNPKATGDFTVRHAMTRGCVFAHNGENLDKADNPTRPRFDGFSRIIRYEDFVAGKGCDGLVLENATNVLVYGSIATAPWGAVIRLKNCRDVKVWNCAFQGSAAGILAENVEGLDICGSVFRLFAGTSTPIRVVGCTDVKVRANTFGEFGFGFAPPDGLVAADDPKSVTVFGNAVQAPRMNPAKCVLPEGNAVYSSPVLFAGDDVRAFRDPAVFFNGKGVDLYYTVVETQRDGSMVSYVNGVSTRDFFRMDGGKPVTPVDPARGYSSPGNVVKVGDEQLLCCCSYPRPGHKVGAGLRWADETARCYLLRRRQEGRKMSAWSEPELMALKGPDVAEKDMGRMIDPYLVEDPKTPGKWWCFFKQGGISRSWTTDFKTWHYAGKMKGGENVCIIRKDDGKYLMFHSPKDGIGLKESEDLENWTDCGMAEIAGRDKWPWAQGRLTAASVVDLRKMAGVGQYAMFFHGSGPGPETDQMYFDANASIAVVFSDDLIHWHE